METFTITQINELTSATEWNSKMESVILVGNESEIDRLYELLVEQDDYWEGYKNLIKVAPKQVSSYFDLQSMCEYCGKTDIYNEKWTEIQEQVPFFVYQYSGC